jgi:hypothetical protein
MSHRGPSTKHGVRSAVSAHQPNAHAAVLVQPAAIDHRSLAVQSASPTGGAGDREALCSALVICSSGSDLSRPL